MSNEKLSTLRTQRNSLYSEWVSLALDNPKYNELKSQIESLDSQIFAEDVTSILKRQENDHANPGKEYDPSLAVYVNKGEIEGNAERLARLSGYPKRESGEVITDPQELADIKWRNEQLTSNINGSQWLSNIQVEAATGEKVSVGLGGKIGLEAVLESKKGNLPATFAHIITAPNDDNHFVSFDIRKGDNGKTEITFVDSNGELMPPAERAAILKKFPGAEIKYLDKEGNKISEREAAQNPDDKLLRVQFDDHNCGLYTSHFVNMLKVTDGNPELIKAGAQQIKEISKNPSAYRQLLSQELRTIANDNSHEQELLAGKQANLLESILKKAETTDRQAQRSASIIGAITLPERETKKSASVSLVQEDNLIASITGKRKSSDDVQTEKSESVNEAKKHSTVFNFGLTPEEIKLSKGVVNSRNAGISVGG